MAVGKWANFAKPPPCAYQSFGGARQKSAIADSLLAPWVGFGLDSPHFPQVKHQTFATPSARPHITPRKRPGTGPGLWSCGQFGVSACLALVLGQLGVHAVDGRVNLGVVHVKALADLLDQLVHPFDLF